MCSDRYDRHLTDGDAADAHPQIMESTYLHALPADILRNLLAGWRYEFDCFRTEKHAPEMIVLHLQVRIPAFDDLETYILFANDFPLPTLNGDYRTPRSRVEYVVETLETHLDDPKWRELAGEMTYGSGGLTVTERQITINGRQLPRFAASALASALRQALEEPLPTVVTCEGDTDILYVEMDSGTQRLTVEGVDRVAVGGSIRIDHPGREFTIHDTRTDRRYIVSSRLEKLESSDPLVLRFRLRAP